MQNQFLNFCLDDESMRGVADMKCSVVIIMLCVVSAADHFYLSVSIIGPALSTESRPNNASSRRERGGGNPSFSFSYSSRPRSLSRGADVTGAEWVH